jgi:hypothetical protein
MGRFTLVSHPVLASKIRVHKRALWAVIAEARGRSDERLRLARALRRRSCAREPGIEKAGDRVRQRRRRVRVAPIAIDKAGHGRRAVAGAEPDAERTAVVLELRLELAVPNDDDARALTAKSAQPLEKVKFSGN